MTKVAAIIQARVHSTRLPGKVLMELPYLSGITVLQQVIRRLRRSKRLDGILVATTSEPDSDKIVQMAKKEDVGYYRGSTQDVLSRYYHAADQNNIDVIVRITSDCPCVDAGVLDSITDQHLMSMSEYTSNTLTRTYPHGLDIEIINFSALEQAHRNAIEDYEREHVTPHIYRNPQIFNLNQVEAPQKLYGPDIRVTLDTEEDYVLLCTVFDYLYPSNEYFSANDLVELFRAKPWLKLINRKVSQKKIFDTLQDEIQEAIKILDLQDLRGERDLLAEHITR